MKGKSALILGSTGLIGRTCLALLSEHPAYDRIIAPGRREQTPPSDKVICPVIDFDNPADQPEWHGVDEVFCCLGTTIKKAGSQERFRTVDFDYPISFAGRTRANGARHYLIVTANGASSRSKVFYNRVKGEVEDALAAERFSRTSILRPSLLVGDRDEHRPGERAGQIIGGLLSFAIPKRYKPIAGDTVARALVRIANTAGDGIAVYENEAIQRLGGD